MLNKSFIGVILLVILVVSPLFSQQYPVNDEGKSPFDGVQINYTRSVEESKAINDKEGPMIIISASGM